MGGGGGGSAATGSTEETLREEVAKVRPTGHYIHILTYGLRALNLCQEDLARIAAVRRVSCHPPLAAKSALFGGLCVLGGGGSSSR